MKPIVILDKLKSANFTDDQARVIADIFEKVSFEKIAEDYYQKELKLLGIANVVDSKPELKDALNHAVSAIYFNDNSDYLIGLYGVVSSITGLEDPTDDDITNLFKNLNPK